MKIVSIVGARPEFIQAMPVSCALRPHHEEILVHTGQHYDYRMSQAFFEELHIPAPDYNLEVGSGSQAVQTARILERMEEVLEKERPDLVIVRGDTNSTLASSLAASKLCIPLAHIEAGERSFDMSMPEEINRLVTDCLTELYFCASENAVRRLKLEGITDNVFWVGDVMLDAMLMMIPVAQQKSCVLDALRLIPGAYSLVTIHRQANTDNPFRLSQIIEALNNIRETIVFPVHPRTRKALSAVHASFRDHVRLIDPVGYWDMLVLEENARMIATDSGGVQREAYFLGKPCLILRDETEWVAIVEVGWNRLVGANRDSILEAWFNFNPPVEHPAIFGDGKAAWRIAQLIDRGTEKLHRLRGYQESTVLNQSVMDMES
jgi:UDP-GlcNAc3NAcA epimerase